MKKILSLAVISAVAGFSFNASAVTANNEVKALLVNTLTAQQAASGALDFGTITITGTPAAADTITVGAASGQTASTGSSAFTLPATADSHNGEIVISNPAGAQGNVVVSIAGPTTLAGITGTNSASATLPISAYKISDSNTLGTSDTITINIPQGNTSVYTGATITPGIAPVAGGYEGNATVTITY